MPFQPIDLDNISFNRAFRGYKKEEVDNFLENIRLDLESLYRENKELKQRYRLLEEEMKKYKDLENSIQETLVMAQKLSEDAKKNAQKEIELIYQEAENNIQKAKEDYLSWQRHIKEVKIKFKIFLEEELALLEEELTKTEE